MPVVYRDIELAGFNNSKVTHFIKPKKAFNKPLIKNEKYYVKLG
jgi:hypothetical protein